ncbi:MAG: helix-turn-helix transcriptional regulator [Thermoleophilia bacterium]
MALLDGDAAAAVEVLDPVIAGVEASGVYEWPIAFCAPDAIEALAAAGHHARAAGFAASLRAWGALHDRPWCTAIGCRGAAMAAAQAGELPEALAHVEEATAAHDRLEMPLERARTLLLRGQIERRLKRRAAARRTVEEAGAEFARLGAEPFARRASEEIARVAGRRAAGGLSQTELSVARMAAQGSTNAGIAAALFMSRRTVESNLARAYAKLAVSSRTQLANVMRDRGLLAAEAPRPGRDGTP